MRHKPPADRDLFEPFAHDRPEHQDVPESMLRLRTSKMFSPLTCYRLGNEENFGLQPLPSSSSAHPRSGPRSHVDRDAETHLGPVGSAFGTYVEDLPQSHFLGPRVSSWIAAASRRTDQTMIEQGNTRFEVDTHAGAVHFDRCRPAGRWRYRRTSARWTKSSQAIHWPESFNRVEGSRLPPRSRLGPPIEKPAPDTFARAVGGGCPPACAVSPRTALARLRRQPIVTARKHGIPPFYRYPPERLGRELLDQMWRPASPAPDVLGPPIARVTAKQFIATVAGQAYRHVPARQLRDQDTRNLGGIGKRLIINRRQSWDHRHRVGRRYVEFGMICSQVFSNKFGMFRFVIRGLLESDRKGPDPPCTLRLH